MKIVNRTLFFILFFILLSINVISIEECESGTLNTDDIPCLLFYPINNTAECNNYTITHYVNSTVLFSITLSQYNQVYCNSTMNITIPGTYSHKWSSGDTGSLIIERGNTMIYLLYFSMALIAGMFLLGYYLQDVGFLGVGGMMLMAFSVYVAINGFNGLNNLLTDIIALPGILIGFYVMIRSVLEYADLNKIGG